MIQRTILCSLLKMSYTKYYLFLNTVAIYAIDTTLANKATKLMYKYVLQQKKGDKNRKHITTLIQKKQKLVIADILIVFFDIRSEFY